MTSRDIPNEDYSHIHELPPTQGATIAAAARVHLKNTQRSGEHICSSINTYRVYSYGALLAVNRYGQGRSVDEKEIDDQIGGLLESCVAGRKQFAEGSVFKAHYTDRLAAVEDANLYSKKSGKAVVAMGDGDSFILRFAADDYSPACYDSIRRTFRAGVTEQQERLALRAESPERVTDAITSHGQTCDGELIRTNHDHRNVGPSKSAISPKHSGPASGFGF